MSTIIIIINIAAILYMRTHKIPLKTDNRVLLPLIYFVMLYIITGFLSFVYWTGAAIDNVDNADEDALLCGRVAHIMGFCIFLDLFYCISPHLALRFGVPLLLLFVAALVGSFSVCMERCMNEVWWKFVNQPHRQLLMFKGFFINIFVLITFFRYTFHLTNLEYHNKTSFMLLV